MKLAIMQPYIFPYIGYFQLINLVDEFVFYNDVNFIKKGFINKNNLLINGEANSFTIPLVKASQNKLINEVEIINDSIWKKKFLTSIQFAYKKAIMFNSVYPFIEQLILCNHATISELAIESNVKISNYLGLNTIFSSSSEIESAKKHSGQERIIDICKSKKASHYINPIGGMKLYSDELFDENNIQLSFLATEQDIHYNQVGKGDFVSNLSIIDVLMNNDKPSVKKLLESFHLKSKS